MATTPPPAGWYRDPAARFDFRYWNGDAWTDAVQRDGVRAIDGDARAPEPVAVAVEDAVATERARTRSARWPLPVLVVVIGGAVLLAVGALLPWAEAKSTLASFSERGLDGLGAVSLLAGILVVLAIALMQPTPRAAACVTALGTLALGVGVYEAIDTSRKADDLVARSPAGVTAGVGVGVWVTIGAAVIVLVGGAMAFVVARRTE